MLSTKLKSFGWGGRRLILPLFLFWGCTSSSSSQSVSPVDTIPAVLRDSMRKRLYPLIAGAHAQRDSIESYRWELWEQRGETLYFGLSRPARSLYPSRCEAVVGRCIPRDTGFAYYEELFWTYRFPKDTIRAVINGVFSAWRKGTPLDSFQEEFISFPDPYSFYDVRLRRWRRVIGSDTISDERELWERRGVSK
ncbi:MAG: hypothetical protein N2253_00460 [Bacteroidia bacterium]|nr:hypothetical protein [Bacteroidia bacterium]